MAKFSGVLCDVCKYAIPEAQPSAGHRPWERSIVVNNLPLVDTEGRIYADVCDNCAPNWFIREFNKLRPLTD